MTLIDLGLELLDDRECWRLLRDGVIGRIGVSVGSVPAIFPVNYAVVDGDIVFCTAPGTKLSAALRKSVVAFEVDSFQVDQRTGWSVLVMGRAEEVYDARLIARVFEMHRGPWADGDRSHIVKIAPSLVTGRRIPAHNGIAAARTADGSQSIQPVRTPRDP